MLTVFDQVVQKNDLIKVRIFTFIGFVSSFIFYFLMQKAFPEGLESIPIRVLIAVTSILGFVSTFIFRKPKIIHWIYSIMGLSYVFGYLYLLHLNQWSVFHRWGYFVVCIVLAGAAVSWTSYLIISITAVLSPVVISYFSPIQIYEMIHFHSANIVVFVVIGVAVKSFFEVRSQFIQLNHEMMSTSQLAALGKMAGGMAHEINNPLAIINGYLHRLKKARVEPQDPELEVLIKIEKAVFRIHGIIDSLMKFSATQNNEDVENIHLKDIIQEIIQMNQGRIDAEQIEVDNLIHIENDIILGKSKDIRLAILQIFNNAMDAVKSVEFDKKIIFDLNVHPQAVLLSIADNGPGLRSDVESSLMRPFTTTKDIGAGKGLGLSIAYGIVTALGGKLNYQRKDNKTYFEFHFPKNQK